MSLFNVSINEPTKKDKKELFDSLYAQLLKNQNCESTKGNHSFEIQKCKLNTILRFNTKVAIESKSIQVDAELHDTLLLTILVVIGILFTYGIGVILVIAFAYLQKRKAAVYLKKIIKEKKTS